MKTNRPLLLGFVALLGLAILGSASPAVSQVLPFALAAKQNIDLWGNGLAIDSFDSNNTNYSTLGRYDPAKRKAGGDVASIAGTINAQNTEIMGTLYTGPSGSYTIGSYGTAGDLGWVQGRTNGVQPGHYRNDLTVDFADVQPPYTSGLVPASKTINGTNYIWCLGNQDYMCVDFGGVTFHAGDRVLVTGHARMYVTGRFIMTGDSSMRIMPGASLELYVGGTNAVLSTICNAGSCGTFTYYGLAGNQTVALSGLEAFVGCIYAPNAALSVTSGGGTNGLEFQGACTVMSVSMNGHCRIHYDEHLGRSTAFPWSLLQPPSQVIAVGQTVTFTPSVTGALPLSYQWRLNGTNIPGVTNATYTITNAQPIDAGAYSIVLTNYFGSATSSDAALIVNIQPTLAVQTVAGYPLLALSGILSSNFVVQYSTNLADTNWLNLLTLTNLPSCPYLFSDPDGPGDQARFYRAFMQ
jgi:hypothetical protein